VPLVGQSVWNDSEANGTNLFWGRFMTKSGEHDKIRSVLFMRARAVLTELQSALEAIANGAQDTACRFAVSNGARDVKVTGQLVGIEAILSFGQALDKAAWVWSDRAKPANSQTASELLTALESAKGELESQMGDF